jgi:hypothetical protein
LQKPMLKKWLCQKNKLARKNKPGEKARTKLAKTFAEKM